MIERPPKIENTPGLTWRLFPGGWEARWRARADLVKRGYTPKSASIWTGWEPNEIQKAFITDRCNALQSEMLVWGRGGIPMTATFDGTIRGLSRAYQTDPDSAYHTKRYRTKLNYSDVLRRIEQETWTADDGVRVIGEERLEDIKARTLLRWHEQWSAGGKIAMGHGLMGMLRIIFGFGATILENEECDRLCGVMHKMRFKMPKHRTERMTAEQAIAIRSMARRMGLPSIALAQALQFEVMLRQKDVIGEWVPLNEPGVSDVTYRDQKWLWGIRWSEIDDNLILRHVTSKKQKPIEFDLKLAPMVMEELALMEREATGPVIVFEKTGLPYVTFQFRREWRPIADACGIPKTVRNMDSRAGGISEATDAGAELEHVRHAATHSDIGMTQRYSRGSVEKIAGVMRRRAEYRNNKGMGGGENGA